jgi:hypothetical protein
MYSVLARRLGTCAKHTEEQDADIAELHTIGTKVLSRSNRQVRVGHDVQEIIGVGAESSEPCSSTIFSIEPQL